MVPVGSGIQWKVDNNPEYMETGCNGPLLEGYNDGSVCDVADHVLYLEQNLETADSEIYPS
jgi:hypothetical protein